MNKEEVREFFERTATSRLRWKRRNRFYHASLERYFSFIIPPGSRVLELGCGTGDLLFSVKPGYGVGIDFSPALIEIARERYPSLVFFIADAGEQVIPETFDYLILSDLTGHLWDIQQVFKQLKNYCHSHTRVIISHYNFLWEPIMKAGEFLRLKLPQPTQNWLTNTDLETLLHLEGYELVTIRRKLLIPKYIPILNLIFNKFIANLPWINRINLVNILIARPLMEQPPGYSVSVVIPARNEKGNIENAVRRLPAFGTRQEIIFVEGHSSDQTLEEMERVRNKFPDKDIRILQQSGKGKGNAVREAFDAADGDILMILDADLTTPPEELPKFYEALCMQKGELINGCRLVYPMEKEAMRFLNLVANRFFGVFFTYLLGQRLKDTLCGTKVLFRSDYQTIRRNRAYFGDFDPFGDFDLLFGAAKMNLKITEIIVRYKDRTYGSTQISRFRHGLLLIRMSIFAARKIRFN